MFRKDDVKRLERILKDMDQDEAYKQSRFGDRIAGGVRARCFRDANAIRRILEDINRYKNQQRR